jgi:UDP-N-acetylglucosamine/UDP-N-acetyl-alpha-D-glucosaminouronate 4-epimerase
MASYLVTGGAGFIGSHLVEELLRRGHRVRIADSLVTGKPDNVRQATAAARQSGKLTAVAEPELLVGDLADASFAQRAVEGMEFVLHQAAIPSVPRSVDDPITSNRANIDATLSLLVAARDARVRRVVYAGSSSAYGDTEVLPKREDMPANPLSPYALQKLVGEQYMQLFKRLYGLETVTIRYFNVFGPRQDPSSPYSGVISVFLRALTEGWAPTIHGDGEQTRDFTFVSDAVNATIAAAERSVPGRAYNVGGGSRVSMNQVLEILSRIAGKPLSVVRHAEQKGDMRDTYADTTLARTELGFVPSVSLEQGLEMEYRWLSSSSRA